MKGIRKQLFNGAVNVGAQSGWQVMFWDVQEPKDGLRPIGKAIVSTDADGYLNLDISNITGLALGEFGFLQAYKLDATDHRDSPVFVGRVEVEDIEAGDDLYYYGSGWNRPADWLALPALVGGDQKLVGLYAVYPGQSNFVALTVSGAYTVDWGDGTTENFSAGVTAQRNIDYNAVALDGTECSRGYKQTIITVSPQSGQNLTDINVAVKHNQAGLSNCAPTWLDIAINAPNMTALNISNNSSAWLRLLEQIWLGQNAVTDFSNMFNSCYSLQSIPLLDTAAGTTFSNMFNSCFSLQSIPLLNTAAGTAFSSMFSSCYSLQSIPLLDTAAGTTFSSMFNSCYSLQSIPLLNTAAGTTFSSMFNSCYSLQSIPLLNTAAGTAFSSMFSNCSSLQSIPLLDTAAGTAFSNMFNNCYSLQSIPLLDTAAGTALNSIFNNCYSLQSIPLLNTAAGTALNSIFNNCSSLSRGALNGTARTNISYSGCKLSGAELDYIYDNLGTAIGSPRTITVTGNWGTATHTPSIATAKGWTVTV